MTSELPPVEWTWLGRVRHRPIAALQEQLRAEVLAGSRADTLLLCEHDPVITLGRRGDQADILCSSEELVAAGIEVERASRGGEATYHGPGQLVGYPVMRLRRGVLAHLEAMAAGIVAWLAQQGITAEWRRHCPGVWVGPAKICAFGVHVRHGVAIHGFALNVTTDLQAFTKIVPCGIRDCAVTSVAALRGSAPPLEQVARALVPAFRESYGLRFVEREAAALAQLLDCKIEIGTDTMIKA